MRPVVPVVLALLLASCTSGTAKPAASGSPTPAATQAPSPTVRTLVLAVTRKDQPGIELYRVGPARQALRVGRLEPPQGHRALYDLTVGPGEYPDVCVLWGVFPVVSDAGGAESAYCYPGAGPVGRSVATGSFGTIALDASGTRLFWSTVGESEQVEGGVVADYSKGEVRAARTFAIDCSRYVLSVVWAGEGRLAMHCTSGDNDDPGSLWTQELGSGSWSPLEGQMLGDYEQFGSPGGAEGASVLALEHVCEADCGTEFAKKSPARAVRVDLSTGRVLEVVATPAEGRFLSTVTGGVNGIVYVTEAEGQERDARVYLRWPGEKHGTPITGLPADVEEVVAQP